jgi:hypothetical protein
MAEMGTRPTTGVVRQSWGAGTPGVQRRHFDFPPAAGADITTCRLLTIHHFA